MTCYRIATRPIGFCPSQSFAWAPRAAASFHFRLLSTSLPASAANGAKKQKDGRASHLKTSKVIPITKGAAKVAKKHKGLDGKKTPAPKLGVGSERPRGVGRPRRRRGRIRSTLGRGGFGVWGVRWKYMRKGPRSPGFRERKLDPLTTTLRWAERKNMKQGIYPIGSRRRRVAIRTSPNLPFEYLPYQCFQEAMNVLRQDRQEKLDMIASMEKRLAKMKMRDASTFKGGEKDRFDKIRRMKQTLDKLIIEADINDPEVKRRSEDSLGDMNKPIYQMLARERWEAYRKKILEQRVKSFKIVPDVLPKLDITADVELRFGGRKIEPGSILPASVTERPPTLKVQVFDSIERLVSVVIVDSDVPDDKNDSFLMRCHYLAVNIPLDIKNPNIILRCANTAVPWFPPHSQKGLPYHRLGIYILEQKLGRLDKKQIAELYESKTGGHMPFSLKSFRDKFSCKPFAFNIFRTVWDSSTKEVMERHGIPGADIEWKRNRNPRIKPLRRRRGWEAKRQKPKYKHLWKYTKRIKGWNDRKWRTDKRDKQWKV